MALNEYRRHAAECLLIADEITDPNNKLLLVAMAQAWLRLARRAEEDLTPDFVYETSSPLGKTAQAVERPQHIHPPTTDNEPGDDGSVQPMNLIGPRRVQPPCATFSALRQRPRPSGPPSNSTRRIAKPDGKA